MDRLDSNPMRQSILHFLQRLGLCGCVVSFLVGSFLPLHAQRKKKSPPMVETPPPVMVVEVEVIHELESEREPFFEVDGWVIEQRLMQDLMLAVKELGVTEPEQAQELFFTVKPDNIHSDDVPLYQRLARQYSIKQLSAFDLGLANGNISALAVDEDDLWVGDWQGGITRYSLTTGQRLSIRSGRATLTARRVNAILVERSDVWVVCSDAVVHYNKRSGRTSIIPKPSVQGYAQTILRYNNKLYVGLQNGGLWLFDGQNFIEQSLPSNSSNSITTLFTHENRLYIGTASGLLWLSPQGFVEVNLLSGKHIRFITSQLDSSSLLWVGTAGQGFHEWSSSPPALTQIPTSDSWLTAGIVLNSRNILLVGQSEGGLFTMRKGNSTARRLDFSPLNAGLWRVSALASYADWVVVGTAGDGVVLLHETLF